MKSLKIKKYALVSFLQGVFYVTLATLILFVIDQPLFNWLLLKDSSILSEFTTYDYTANNSIIILIWVVVILLLLAWLLLQRRLFSYIVLHSQTRKNELDDSIITQFTFSNGIMLAIPFFLTVYYFVLRFQVFGLEINGLEFSSFRTDPPSVLKHLDILLILLVAWFIYILYIFWPKNIPQKTSILENDSPITHSDDDLLNLRTIALALADEIKGWIDHKASFTIGLSGRWGTGKTSLMNLLKNELTNNPNNIIIDFNAWQYETEINLSAPFLRELQLRLKPYSLNSSKSFDSYIHEILQSNNSFYTKLSQIFSPSISVNELILKIRQDIITSGKRFIVFIDDLDRLQAKEMIEVFNIIRNVGNLPNTVFILAYDKEYIINQLKECKINRPDEYFTKFLQLEIPVGKIVHDKLKERLIGQLKIHFASQFYDAKNQKLTDANVSSQMTVESFIVYTRVMQVLHSIRDIKRFINALIIQMRLKVEQIEFHDLFVLEAIRLKYPTQYEILKHDRQRLLSEENGFLKYNHNNNTLNSIEDNTFIQFMKLIFPQDNNTDNKKSIHYKRYYDNYFTFDSVKDIRDKIDQIMYEN